MQCAPFTHHAFSSGAGRTSDGNGSHASTLKSPSYTWCSVPGFHNDSTPRYDKSAADLAWQRTLKWFDKYLS